MNDLVIRFEALFVVLVFWGFGFAMGWAHRERGFPRVDLKRAVLRLVALMDRPVDAEELGVELLRRGMVVPARFVTRALGKLVAEEVVLRRMDCGTARYMLAVPLQKKG